MMGHWIACWSHFMLFFFVTYDVYVTEVVSSDDFVVDNEPFGSETENGYSSTKDDCEDHLYGIEWLLQHRRDDYGWGEETHRAIITIFMDIHENKTVVDLREKELMIRQLEIELSKAITRNGTEYLIPESELTLYIHALLTVGRNPRNFADMDLVAALESFPTRKTELHPFTVLCLCNSRALRKKHLNSISSRLTPVIESDTSVNIELKAIALKAFACAAEEKLAEEFQTLVEDTALSIAEYQNEDGSFWNVFTTALVVQALKTLSLEYAWDEAKARSFLQNKRILNSDIMAIYYIEMALRTDIDFIKQMSIVPTHLTRHSPLEDYKGIDHGFVTYTLKVGDPKIYHSISLDVPDRVTFLDVMKLAANADEKFNFSHGYSAYGEAYVYSIGGIPNDAEYGLYWRLYKLMENKPSKKDCEKKEVFDGVNRLQTKRDDHYIFWFLDIF